MRLGLVTLLLFFLTITTGLGNPLAPLVQGRVLDDAGVPIASARVELRQSGRLITADRSDREGLFQLQTNEAWASDWLIRVERLGYAPEELAVPEDFGVIDISMTAAPLPLPGFEIFRDREICTREPQSEAREIWSIAAERHAAGLDTVGVASYLRVQTDTLANRTDVGVGGDGAAAVSAIPGQRASAPLLRLTWDRRVSREGYAFPVRRTDRDGSYDSWGYPPLEADFAPHFGSETFGERHNFLIEAAGSDGWVVHFCAREQSEPYLDGVLEIGPDTLIRRAEWSFHTPEPLEQAGGWVRFPPSESPGASAPLLPTESVTWTALPDGRVVRRAQWYEGWSIVAGDSVPFLPQRDAAQD
jgi:hypothetical protein